MEDFGYVIIDGKWKYVPQSQINYDTRKNGKQLTPYGTFRDIVESHPEIIGYNRTSYGTKQDTAKSEADSGRFLHGGGGNEALRDLGIAYQKATERARYERDNSWVESIIPEISGRSNIIPKIKQAKQEISNKSQNRQQEIMSLQPKKEAKKKEIEEIKNRPINVPRFTSGGTWGPPQGFYNNEYDYAVSGKNIAIANAEADLREMENAETNYKEDLKQAENLNKLLGEYEKEKKFEFLNDYESRTGGGAISFSGPDVPALTPSGSMRYKSKSSSGYKAVGFDVPQMPFEQKPIINSRPRIQYEDKITKQIMRQEIPFKNDFGLAGRKEKRFNPMRFFG